MSKTIIRLYFRYLSTKLLSMKQSFLLTLGFVFCLNFTFGQLKPTRYTDGSQILNGYKIPAAVKNAFNPGILILPAWMGIDKASKDIAVDLANLGFHVFIADIYGEGNYPTNYQEASKSAGYYKSNYKEYQKRISLALDELVKTGADPENLAVIGYCFGGTGALEAARGKLDVKGVVSFHGGLARDSGRKIEPISSKVLICHGADDPFESKEEISAFQQEMRDTMADWQMIYYANAVHSFTNSEAGNDNLKGAAYNPIAAKRAFEHLKLFLKETLKQ